MGLQAKIRAWRLGEGGGMNKEKKEEKNPHMGESIGHRPLRGRCPKRRFRQIPAMTDVSDPASYALWSRNSKSQKLNRCILNGTMVRWLEKSLLFSISVNLADVFKKNIQSEEILRYAKKK